MPEDSSSRVLGMLDAELDRLGEQGAMPLPGRWFFLRRRWVDGVNVARSVARRQLQEIRDAYVAEHGR